MYTQMTEQFQTSMKPLTELMEINIKTIETLTEKQTSFFTEAMSDGLAYTQDITSQTDLASILKVQKEYGEDFQEKFMATTKELYSTMVDAQDKISAVMKSAFLEAKEMATPAPAKSPKSTTKTTAK